MVDCQPIDKDMAFPIGMKGNKLNPNRLKEIQESHGVIAVTYQDAPVWIENQLDENMVEVVILDSGERKAVPISHLIETSAELATP